MKKSVIARESARLSNEDLVAEGMVPMREAQRLLGVCRRTVYNLITAGDIVSGLARGKRVVSRVSIDRYNAARLIRIDRRAS